MRGTCSRLGRHRPRTNRYFVEINLDSFLAGRLCTTRHSFSWITREAARPLLASTLLRFRRRFNAKVFSAKLSRVYCLRFSILRRAGRFPTTLFRKTEWIPRPFPLSLDIPTFVIDGYQQLGPPPNAYSDSRTDITNLADTVSMSRGAHLIKAGTDFRWERLDIIQPPSPEGLFRFSAPETGFSLASFLM